MSRGYPRLLTVCLFFVITSAPFSSALLAQDPNPGACVTLGPNLVENPEFDEGNTGFLSSYTFHPDYTCGFGQYTVANTVVHDPIGGALCYSGTGFDLTSIWAASDRNDPGNGHYLILDPTDTAGGAFILWQQTIDVCPGSEYVFSAFTKNLYFLESTFPYSGIDPIFDLTINGNPPSQSYFVDGVLTPGGTFDPLPRQPKADSAVWTQISGRWSSGTNTQAVITIKNTVPGNQGNDLGVDGIFFGLCNRSVDISPDQDIGQCAQLNTVQPVTISVPAATVAAGWQYYEWFKDGALVQADPNPTSFVTPADVNGEYFGTYQLKVYDDPTGPANGACGNVSKELVIFEDCPVSFPVELTEFNGEIRDNQASLTWTTATESQNKGFEIWLASTSSDLEKVGFIPGQGTTEQETNYRFLSGALEPGDYLFQLKQIDFDGQVNISDFVELTVEALDQLSVQVFPNPADETATLAIQLPDPYPVKVELVSLDGRVLFQESFEADQANNSLIWEMPVQDIPEGMYFIRVRGLSQKVIPFAVTH